MHRISITFLSLLVSITGLAVVPANADVSAAGCYGVSNGVMQSVYQLGQGEIGCEGALVIDSSVVRIEYATYIVQGPNKITSISIPKETTFISYMPFSFDTSALEEFIVHPDNPNYSSVDGVLYDKNQTKLISYPRGKAGPSFSVPDTVIEIDQFAFCAQYLESLSISANVSQIAQSAFDFNGSCYSGVLREIVVNSGNLSYTTEAGVLFDKLKTTLIKYPVAKTGTSYVVPNTVTQIIAISWNPNLQSITLPDSLETIAPYALSYSALTSLHIPDSVTAYGPFPTFASGQLQFFTVGEGNNTLKAIDGVIYSKDGTRLIEYPGGKLQSVFTIPSGVTILENQWSSANIYLQRIRIPSSVTEIVGGLYGVLEFQGDSNLASALYISPSQIFYCGVENSEISAAASRANISVQCVIEVASAPGAPTIGSATALSPTSASISFTAPASDGGATIETYTATSTPGSLTGRLYQIGSGSITITGLSPSTAYTFRVTASNSAGTSSASNPTVSITTPAAVEDLAVQAAAQAVAEAAAKKAAEQKREADMKLARSEIVRKTVVSEKLTIEMFSQADIPGITLKNIEAVQAEILTLPEKSRSDLTEILKVARKFEVVGHIASDRPNSIYPSRLVEIGLISSDSQSKSAITQALKNLPASERSTYADIKVAIEKELARIQVRKDRLSSLVSRVSGRR
jgi:hypothetical protein